MRKTVAAAAVVCLDLRRWRDGDGGNNWPFARRLYVCIAGIICGVGWVVVGVLKSAV